MVEFQKAEGRRQKLPAAWLSLVVVVETINVMSFPK